MVVGLMVRSSSVCELHGQCVASLRTEMRTRGFGFLAALMKVGLPSEQLKSFSTTPYAMNEGHVNRCAGCISERFPEWN